MAQRKSYAVLKAPAQRKSIVHLDDRALARRLVEAIEGREARFNLSKADRDFYMKLAETAVSYVEERCEAARVRYS